MQPISPNRSLGQNFFSNPTLAHRIIDSVLENNPETVIEIGPGPGTFTQLLSKRAKVIAIEKDRQFEMLLNQIDNLEVFYQDVLKVDFLNLMKKMQINPAKAVFFGSLPYNIAKRIIANNLSARYIKDHYYIIQKEVADKYSATAPNNNILSLTSGVYAQSKKILAINPGSFNPPPKVISTFIKFSLHDKQIETPEELCKFITTAFAHPRKKLSNNLKKSFKIEKLDPSLLHLLDRRPEQLQLSEFIKLSEQLKDSRPN